MSYCPSHTLQVYEPRGLVAHPSIYPPNALVTGGRKGLKLSSSITQPPLQQEGANWPMRREQKSQGGTSEKSL